MNRRQFPKAEAPGAAALAAALLLEGSPAPSGLCSIRTAGSDGGLDSSQSERFKSEFRLNDTA